jgi:hypothetical protein
VSRYKLKLKRLDFISPVDAPAQETAKVVLIKRKAEGVANVVKVADELGLVFCWAFTSKSEGADYYDLHGDNIDEDFVAAAAEFMENGGPTDEMHDGEPDGRVVFAMPMTPEIAKAFGVETQTTGLMIALKPSADVLAKFKSGEYTAVSIQGMGERVEDVGAAAAKSTRPTTTNQGDAMKIVVLTEAQHAHYSKLSSDDAEAFLAKSSVDRDADVSKAAALDVELYKCDDGTIIRKSQGQALADMAKRADDAMKIAKAEVASRELVELKKRAADMLGALAGTDEVHVELLKAAESISDEAKRTGAIEALKAANAAMVAAGTAKGVNPGADPVIENPQAEYDAAVTKAMADHKVDRFKAADMVLATKRGIELYAAINKRK